MEEDMQIALEVIDIMVGFINMRDMPDMVRMQLPKIVAKIIPRCAGAEDLQEFINRFVVEWQNVYPNSVVMKRKVGQKLNKLLKAVQGRDEEIMRLLVRQAYPLCVIYFAQK